MARSTLFVFFVSATLSGRAVAQPVAATEVAPEAVDAAVGESASAAPPEAAAPPDEAAEPSAPAEAGAAESSAEEPPPVEETAPSEDPPPVEPVAEAPAEAASTEGGADSASEVSVSPPRLPSPFSQGRIRLGVVAGWAQLSTSASSINWLILGVNGGYYVLDGLEPTVGTTFWIGDPFIATLTPGLNYVFHMVPKVKPYVGVFYRHYFVTDNRYRWSDTDALGGRLGAYFMVGPMSYVGGGIAYEHFLDQDLYSQVDQFYPEITISMSF